MANCASLQLFSSKLLNRAELVFFINERVEDLISGFSKLKYRNDQKILMRYRINSRNPLFREIQNRYDIELI